MQGPFAVLAPISKSHPFEERKAKVGPEEDSLKIGRAVARVKAAKDNAIFDCKVLSRNHAIMWYKDGNFFLRDTKSSNGTYVNNERLSDDDVEGRQIFSGDIIQLGVEIVENTNKLAHGCIYALTTLYDGEGKLVENTHTVNAAEEGSSFTGCVGGTPSLLNSHQLYQMQQFIAEAMHREKQREEKMGELMKIIEASEHAAQSAWKALVNEDRLLARIEMLEAQLGAYSKNSTPEKQRDEMLAMIDEKARFEAITKETMRRLYEEKSEAVSRLADTERSLVSTEDTCNILRRTNEKLEERLRWTVELFDAKAADCDAATQHANEAERCLNVADERIQTTQLAAAQMQNERDAALSPQNLMRNLIGALSCGASFDPEDVKLLGALVKEGDKRFSTAIENRPSLSPPTTDISDSDDSNKENLESLKRESEGYLKETLQLQARVRDLEAQLHEKPDNGRLEMHNGGTVSWLPAKMGADEGVVRKIREHDALRETVFMFSIAPLLAVFLSFIFPLHSRFFKVGVDKAAKDE